MKFFNPKRIIIMIGFAVILLLALFSVKGKQSTEMPDQSTLSDNALAICGEKPNCVSSFQDNKDSHYIEPQLVETFNTELINKTVLDLNCTPVQSEPNYLYFKCISHVFQFVDDLELLYNEDQSTIYFRSSSRVGHSDLGANRSRVEKIRATLK